MRIRKALKIIGTIVALVFALGAAFFLLNWTVLTSFPALPSSYEAKELCSCIFIEGRTQAECEAFIRQDVVGIDGRDFDVDGKRVTVRALWSENTAHYVSPRLGCVID